MSDQSTWGGGGWGGDQPPADPPSWGPAPAAPTPPDPSWGTGGWAPQQPPPLPGQDAAPQWGQAAPPQWGQTGTAPPFGQPGWNAGVAQAPFGAPPRSGPDRTVVIVLSIVGALVLVGVIGIIAFFNFVGDRVDTVVEEIGEFDDGTTLDIPAGPRLLDESGQVADVGGRQSFDIVATRSGEIQVDVIGRDGFDPIVTLLDSSGSLLAQDDDGGDLLDAQLVHPVEEGRYTVQVEGYAEDTGSFQVIVTQR
jgi:hypothetical protein